MLGARVCEGASVEKHGRVGNVWREAERFSNPSRLAWSRISHRGERRFVADARVPGVARGLGCVGVAVGPPTTEEAAGLYALISCPPLGRVLLPPT